MYFIKIIKLKTIFALLMVLIMAHGVSGTAGAADPRVTADAALLIEVESGRIHFAKNHVIRFEPASLTKLMTAVVAVENGNLTDVVTITKRAAYEETGSIIDLRLGEKISLNELLKAALISSANDSTVAIAEHVGGSHDMFVEMMNHKARSLGMLGTRYANTNGFHHPNHYSTAYDLALLTRYALGHPEINQLVQTREATVQWTEPPDREKIISNSNRLLLGDYKGIDGVKTGTTSMAGNCLIASATRHDRRLIAVALHSDDRYRDCLNMFDYGFDVIRPVILVGEGGKVATQTVTGGVSLIVDAVAAKDVVAYLDPDLLPEVETMVELADSVSAPVKQGQALGQVTYFLRGQELGSTGVVAGTGVSRKGWPGQLWEKVF